MGSLAGLGRGKWKSSKEKDVDVVVVVNCLALGENCIASAEGVVGCM